MHYFHAVPSLALAAAVAAQTRLDFTEILVDPVGPNVGFQLVEVHNNGNLAVDLTGWVLVSTTGTFALPAVVVPADGIALLHVARAGTNTPSDVYLPAMPALAAADSLALFRTAATSNPADLVDFVSWGGGQGAIGVAVLANQWPSTTDTIVPPATQGSTMAHYDQYVYSSNLGSESWFVDGTPTLGTRNDGGGIFAAGYGCPQLVYPPQIGTGENDNRPWIGETWRLDTSYLPVLPTFVWIAIGLQPFPPLPLDPFGIAGCSWSTSPDLVFAAYVQSYPGPVFVQVPNLQLLVGYQLGVQALVPAPGANAAGLLPTRELWAYPGSR